MKKDNFSEYLNNLRGNLFTIISVFNNLNKEFKKNNILQGKDTKKIIRDIEKDLNNINYKIMQLNKAIDEKVQGDNL